MLKKVFALLCTCVVVVGTIASCDVQTVDTAYSMKSLSEIRAEADDWDTISAKFENLKLSETAVYVPDADKMNFFLLNSVELSPEQREEYLLETAQLLGDSQPDLHDIVYLNYDSEKIPYSEVKTDPERNEDKYYFVKYLTDALDIGINIGGNYIYARRKDIAEIAGSGNEDYWIDRTGKPSKTYNLREKTPDTAVLVQDGEQKISEIVELMINTLSETPFYKIDKLKLCADEAQVYSLGDKSAVNISFFYEYNGIPIDSYFRGYGMNIETGLYDTLRTSMKCEASAAWKNSIDELYGAHYYSVSESEEYADKFIGLEDFLSRISEKLTGNTSFDIESVELVYGLNRVLSDEYYSTPDAKPWEYTTLRLEAEPVWIANIPQTGIADTPNMRIVMNAATGEIEMFR